MEGAHVEENSQSVAPTVRAFAPTCIVAAHACSGTWMERVAAQRTLVGAEWEAEFVWVVGTQTCHDCC